MTNTAFVLCVTFGAFFDLHSIPLDTRAEQPGPVPAQTFFANADEDNVADLFVLEGSLLSVHLHSGEVRQTKLPQGVSIFDVADIDKDGSFEIAAVQGPNVVRIPLALQGDAPGPTTLFTAPDSLWANATDGPVPRVLVVDRQGSVAIGVPTSDGMHYRRIDGATVEQVPYERIDRHNRYIQYDSYGLDSTGLSLRYECITTFQSPDQETDFVHEGSLYESHGSVMALRGAVNEEPVNWPWFIVRHEKNAVTRAYCAVEESMVTVVRTCDATVDADGYPDGVAAPGPPRRYPGALAMPTTDFPDFNGDGYKDLLLWNAPRPGISVDALLRAIVGRNWPITLTVHLYSPSKGRFEPEAATALAFRIPVTWFLNGPSPMRYPVFADFNGDKKTDLAMCTEEQEYSVWLYSDGFAATPDEKHTFAENITGVESAWDVAGNGKTSIVLRSDRYVYALYAK